MNNLAKIEPHRQSLVVTMANNYSMDPAIFSRTVRQTCMPGQVSDEDFAAFLMVAHAYDLNPVTREIFAFPRKGGGVQPIVSVDGWFKLMNLHPQANGVEYEDQFDTNGKLSAVTCKIYRKDRERPTVVTEYMDECQRPTEPWQKWPKRMLRHKAFIQCARTAFGFAGIIDQDEAERSPDVITGSVVAPAPQLAPPAKTEAITVIDNGEQTTAVQEFDSAAYFEELEASLAAETTVEGVEERWNEYDPEGTFDGDDLNLEIAGKIKSNRLAQIAKG